MIRYNLQFFAKEGMGGEKTEPATQKNWRMPARKDRWRRAGRSVTV